MLYFVIRDKTATHYFMGSRGVWTREHQFTRLSCAKHINSEANNVFSKAIFRGLQGFKAISSENHYRPGSRLYSSNCQFELQRKMSIFTF